MSAEKAQMDKGPFYLGTLLTSVIFGLGALAVVVAGLTIPLPGTDVVTDPRELFTTIGAALTGPAGGVIIGFLAGIREPVVLVPSVMAHVAGGLWMGFAYRWLVYERLQMPRRILGWAGLVLLYYYVVLVPGFVLGQALTLPASEVQSQPIATFLLQGYSTLASGAVPEALLATLVTSLVLFAVPRKYHRPLWGGTGSAARYTRKSGDGSVSTREPIGSSSAGVLKGIARRIPQIRGTLAWRLAILLMLMSFLPIAVMVIFVRQTVAEALVALTSQETLVQTRQLAAEVSLLDDETSILRLLTASGDESHQAFVVGTDGSYLVLTPNRTTGSISPDTFAPNMVRDVLSGREGATLDKESGRIVGYSPVPGKDAVAVIVMEGSVVANSTQSLEQSTFVQLGASLLMISIIGGVMIWLVMGPIRSLTRSAEQIGAGNFDIYIDPSEMEGELAVLAAAFVRMAAQLRESYDTLERRVQDRTQELATLNSIAAVVSRSLDLEEVLQAAVDSTLGIVNLEVGGAYRLDEQTRTLTLLAHRGLSDEFVHQSAHLKLENGVALPNLYDGQPLSLRVSEHPSNALETYLQREGLQTLVSIPLVAKGKMVGLVALASRKERQLSPRELSLLAAIGQQVGVALENARLYEQAEESAVIAERSRLARDLHDAVTQTLFSASLIAEVLPRLWERSPDEGRHRLEELRQLTRGALAEMRTLLLELRPVALIETALPELLRQLAEAVTGRARVPVFVLVEGECQLNPEVQVALYRIAQEALNNVAKHSAASRASVTLRCQPDRVELSVSDDGTGIDLNLVGIGHLGLGIMNERAEAIGASLSVTNRPGQGTQVTVIWPEKRID